MLQLLFTVFCVFTLYTTNFKYLSNEQSPLTSLPVGSQVPCAGEQIGWSARWYPPLLQRWVMVVSVTSISRDWCSLRVCSHVESWSTKCWAWTWTGDGACGSFKSFFAAWETGKTRRIYIVFCLVFFSTLRLGKSGGGINYRVGL